MVSPEGDPLDRGVLTVRSWDEIVRTHSARVYHLSYRLTGNPHDAADLTQDVFVQLFRSFPQPAKGSLETWLRRVTTNRFFDQLRRKQRLRFETLADHASERTPSLEPTPSQVFNDQTVDDDMRTALDALSPGVRAAVLLCDIEGLTHSEVAATLGIGINTAHTDMPRSRTTTRCANRQGSATSLAWNPLRRQGVTRARLQPLRTTVGAGPVGAAHPHIIEETHMSTTTTTDNQTPTNLSADTTNDEARPPDFSTAAKWRREMPTAPVPQIAKGPEVSSAGYAMEEIADRVFWLGDGQYQSMFVVSDEGIIAVDAPPTLGNNILRAMARVTKKPVTHVVYSHQHSDHVGAMSIFPDNVPYYAQRFTANRLSSLADPLRPVPTEVFDDTLTIDVGDHSLRLDYGGANHTEGNIFIYVPHQRVLMLVDVIFPGWVPFSNLALSANVPGFINAHEQALTYDFDKLVSGHVTRPGTPEDVRVQLEYVTDLRVTAEAALSSVDLGKTMAPVDSGNAWAVFRAYLDAVAAQTADELVPRWKDRLGGADVFTLPNAWAMAESLRLDLNSMGPFGITP